MDQIVSIIGYDLAEQKWIAYCIEYNLESGHAELHGSWETLIDMCENYVDFCANYGLPEVVSNPGEDAPLREFVRRQTHVYDVRQLSGFAVNEGRLLIDTVPQNWGSIDTGKECP